MLKRVKRSLAKKRRRNSSKTRKRKTLTRTKRMKQRLTLRPFTEASTDNTDTVEMDRLPNHYVVLMLHHVRTERALAGS